MASPKRLPKRPYKEEDILPLMQPQEREVFLSLDPEVRRFLLDANDEEREVFLALPPLEMFRFPKLSADERRAYLRLAPAEKALVAQLDDSQWRSYLSLGAEERKSFAASTSAGQVQARKTQEVQWHTALITKAVEDAFTPWSEAPEARIRVVTAVYNGLSAGATEAQAWSTAVRALFDDVKAQDALCAELAAREGDETARRARASLPQLIDHASGQKTKDDFLAAIAQEAKSGKVAQAQKDAQNAKDLAASLQRALKGRGISG